MVEIGEEVRKLWTHVDKSSEKERRADCGLRKRRHPGIEAVAAATKRREGEDAQVSVRR